MKWVALSLRRQSLEVKMKAERLHKQLSQEDLSGDQEVPRKSNVNFQLQILHKLKKGMNLKLRLRKKKKSKKLRQYKLKQKANPPLRLLLIQHSNLRIINSNTKTANLPNLNQLKMRLMQNRKFRW